MRLSLGTLLAFAAAISAAAAEQQFASLGDLRLESGEVIRDCRIGYRTYGKLDAQRSNAILWPTWFTGTTEQLEGNIGPGKLIDPERWYVITVDALGNGVSTSPSNSTSQPRMRFPKFTIRDMVHSQHRLLTEKLRIRHLRAVMGISMGGMQTFQWVASHPEFMDAAIPIVGTPRLGASDVLLWNAEAEAIRNDREWNGGEYTQQPKLLAVQYMHRFALETPSYRNKQTPPSGTPELMQKTAAESGKFDANNWLRQLEAMLSHDVYRYGAAKPRARMIVVVATQDHMVAPEESIAFARRHGLEPLLLTGDCGHMATSCEADALRTAVAAALR